jgi:PAS domain S-box-containing protein
VLRPGSGTEWERTFWFVFNRTTNPMCLIDEHRRVVEVNDAALTMVGRSRGEVIGRIATDFIAPSDRPRSEQRWQEILEHESADYEGTGTILKANESEFEIDFAARVVRIGGRRLAVYVMLIKSARPAAVKRGAGARGELTKRERQIVTEIAMGSDSKRIAADLHISPETVRTHVRNAMTKLNARTRAQLVALVMSTDGHLHLPRVGE